MHLSLMKNHSGRYSLALLFASVCLPCIAQQKDDDTTLETILITTEQSDQPGQIVTDPKLPRQPIPAQDGADFLRSIAGFNVIRKGGASGDPTFRGMAASRLTILNDNNMVLGGCGSRMDPPTAYISPQNFDRIKVIKGPQTTLYLPANATVLFERERYQQEQSGIEGQLSLTLAQFDRVETNADLTAGNQSGYFRFSGTSAKSNHYEDGDGDTVNSRYDRWNATSELAWTPDEDTLLLGSYTRSDGEVAYADRAMDGSLFDRSQWNIKAEQKHLTPWLERVSFSWFSTDIDHLMDNYQIRTFTPTMMMPYPAVMNPDRKTDGGRFQLDLNPSKGVKARLGADTSKNIHRIRSSMNQLMMPYQDKAKMEDARFSQDGIFVELDYQQNAIHQWFAGLRLDQWAATDQRQVLAKTMTMRIPNPTANQSRNESLISGFARYEMHTANYQLYAGLGRAERFPDYWELIGRARGAIDRASAFFVDPEITKQLDAGWLFHDQNLKLDLSVYYANIEDYILLEQITSMGPETVRNIDAHTWGGEATLHYTINPSFNVQTTLSMARGSNDTDKKALAQQAPTELRFASQYAWLDWQWSALWRLVAKQDRVSINQGTIVGLDTGPSHGFGTLSVNVSREWQNWRLSLGIDNLFDKTYQEFLSKSAANIPGFVAQQRVNEPGRIAWLKLDYTL